ncbi:MAG: hypothetical protein RL115_1743 [Bacteroidota bacterium]|jgi:hypothetical protein
MATLQITYSKDIINATQPLKLVALRGYKIFILT